MPNIILIEFWNYAARVLNPELAWTFFVLHFVMYELVDNVAYKIVHIVKSAIFKWTALHYHIPRLNPATKLRESRSKRADSFNAFHARPTFFANGLIKPNWIHASVWTGSIYSHVDIYLCAFLPRPAQYSISRAALRIFRSNFAMHLCMYGTYHLPPYLWPAVTALCLSFLVHPLNVAAREFHRARASLM